MKIKISLNTKDEWNDCWLQTEYIGKGSQTFRGWIYPTKWSELYKTDGFAMNMWVNNSPVNIKQWVCDSAKHLKSKENERPLTAMQKVSKFFKRIFTWKYSN